MVLIALNSIHSWHKPIHVVPKAKFIEGNLKSVSPFDGFLSFFTDVALSA